MGNSKENMIIVEVLCIVVCSNQKTQIKITKGGSVKRLHTIFNIFVSKIIYICDYSILDVFIVVYTDIS